MLTATQQLLAFKPSKSHESDHVIISSLLYAILQLGNEDDAQGLLRQFLADPYEHRYTYFFPVLAEFGNSNDADAIFNACFRNHHLLEEVPPEVLELLGKLKYEYIKPILIQYAFSSSDYYFSKHAVLGLLNFDCSDIEQLIFEEIQKILKQPLFPEFIPALVCKLQNKTKLLKELYNFGTSICSTDCNAGIIIGFSLCREEGLPYFKKALFDPRWEINTTGTGTIVCLLQGIFNLRLSFQDLFEEVKQIKEGEQLAYSITVLLSLLTLHLRQPINRAQQEMYYKDIYVSLFGCEGDNLINLCGLVNLQDEVYHVQDLMELKMKEEAILLSITPIKSGLL